MAYLRVLCREDSRSWCCSCRSHRIGCGGVEEILGRGSHLHSQLCIACARLLAVCNNIGHQRLQRLQPSWDRNLQPAVFFRTMLMLSMTSGWHMDHSVLCHATCAGREEDRRPSDHDTPDSQQELSTRCLEGDLSSFPNGFDCFSAIHFGYISEDALLNALLSKTHQRVRR